jgi:plastocyanin
MTAPRSSTRPVTLTLVIATALLLLVSCSTGPQKPLPEVVQAPESNGPQTRVIEIRGLKFQPDVFTVHAGDTVEWKNDDIVPHTATTADSKEFDSGRIAVGASWKYVASKKGTYLYNCTLHPNMRAKLIVQ